MIPVRIPGFNLYLGPPKGWDQERDGPCGNLAVKVTGDTHQSAWEPTPTELALLNAGGKVVLSIIACGQPPVAVEVQNFIEEGEPA